MSMLNERVRYTVLGKVHDGIVRAYTTRSVNVQSAKYGSETVYRELVLEYLSIRGWEPVTKEMWD